MMGGPTIYHGTPLSPQSALLSVLQGRGGCVSFFRPDDVALVEQVCATIMYDNGAYSFWQAGVRAGKDVAEDRDWTPFLFVAGNTHFSPWPMGGDTGHSERPVPAQRRAHKRMAVWTEGRASLAHAPADREAGPIVRPLQPGVHWMDRRRAGRMCSISRPHGGSVQSDACDMASLAHAARRRCCAGLSIRQRRQHLSGAERLAL